MKELVRLNGPVSHRPAGTKSIPPPSEANWPRCDTAARNAAVFEVAPSPTPPKSASDAVCARQAVAEYWNVVCASPALAPANWLFLLVHSAGPMNVAVGSNHIDRISWQREAIKH